MKLLIQIPAFNESNSIAATLSELPRNLPGVTTIEWMVIDDGSCDDTSEIAKTRGVDHVLRLPRHEGLAKAFFVGLDKCLDLGADIIVNTDADNQYVAADIPDLILPILNGQAEFVLGARSLRQITRHSPMKWVLYSVGSQAVRWASGTKVCDPRSGFRAFSRAAASKLRRLSSYTYTMDTIIQAGRQNIRIKEIPVRTNPTDRPSRLIKSLPDDLWRSALSITSARLYY